MNQQITIVGKTALGMLASALLAAALVLCAPATQQAHAETGSLLAASEVRFHDVSASNSVTKGSLSISGLEFWGGVWASHLSDEWVQSVYFDIHDTDGNKITITSSNPEVVPIPDEYASFTYIGRYSPYLYGEELAYGMGLSFKVKHAGKTEITISNGTDSITIPAVATWDKIAKITSAEIASYRTVKLAWEPHPAAAPDGYFIKRVETYEDGTMISGFSETVATIKDAEASTVEVEAPWGKRFRYFAIPYIEVNGMQFSGDWSDGMTADIALPKPSVKITAITKASPKGMRLAWSASGGASNFEVLRSTNEHQGYKTIGTTDKTTFVDKTAKRGKLYYYRVRATYPNCDDVESLSYAQMTRAKTKAARKKMAFGKMMFDGYDYSGSWSTSGNWAHSATVFYYAQGSKLNVVSYTGKSLKIFGVDSNMKKTSTKTVKLPKHELWGGFFHGPDGNNYVAVGYGNPKESRSKTVIKVVQFSNAWKKGKTASIKASSGESGGGIFYPFAAGTVAFDMQGITLYMLTCAQGFAGGDGFNHQAGRGFVIDTKNMKAQGCGISSVSHSFNQRVKFKDGSIYLAEHGDVGPRGISLVWQDEFTGKSLDSTKELVPFEFGILKGTDLQNGASFNFTGAKLGGLEVGKDNVLTCGTSQPHGYKVAGVKGFGSYRKNVFVTVTNRSTGESSVKWLTSLNPKGGKRYVGSTRMVKLGDDRFAVIYAIANKNGDKQKVYCTIINNAGKKLVTKKYSNLIFSGNTQPVLQNGSIYWADKANDGSTYMCSIPALV